jgi:CheY-like chemotaxis protein
MLNKQLNVILIDDDPLNAFTIERLVKKAAPDAIMQSFQSGAEAFAYFAGLASGDFPNIILLDLYMPEMDGWQFLDNYRLQGFSSKQCTIYMLSSSIDKRDIFLAEEHGLIQEFLKKPLSREKLISLLAQHQEDISK